MRCPKCGKENPDINRFCNNCGEILEPQQTKKLKCPKCGTENEQGYTFCNKCGSYLEQPSNDFFNQPQSNFGGNSSNQTKKCERCGETNDINAKKCTLCGNEFTQENKTTEQNNQSFNNNQGNQEGTRKCPKCGADVPEGNKYCIKCGASVDPQNNINKFSSNSTAPQKPSTSKSMIFGIIALVLCTVCCVFYITIIASFVFAVLGLVYANKEKDITNNSQRVAGLITSIIALCIDILFVIFLIIGISLGDDIYDYLPDNLPIDNMVIIFRSIKYLFIR